MHPFHVFTSPFGPRALATQSALQLLLIQLEAPVLGKAGSFLLSLQAVLDSLIIKAIPRHRPQLHLTGGENVAQRGEAICQRTHSL